jgi:hypothetical protein
MSRTLLIAALAALALALMLGQGTRPPPHAPPDPAAAAAPMSFITVDLYLDTGAAPLAAWQVEFEATIPGGKVSLVGIEGGGGGDHAAYAKPAHYDPAALAGNRIILAAFSTAPAMDLPTGKSRIARLHLSTTGGDAEAQPAYTLTLRVAADTDGHAIKDAAASTAAAPGDDR